MAGKQKQRVNAVHVGGQTIRIPKGWTPTRFMQTLELLERTARLYPPLEEHPLLRKFLTVPAFQLALRAKGSI